MESSYIKLQEPLRYYTAASVLVWPLVSISYFLFAGSEEKEAKMERTVQSKKQ